VRHHFFSSEDLPVFFLSKIYQFFPKIYQFLSFEDLSVFFFRRFTSFSRTHGTSAKQLTGLDCLKKLRCRQLKRNQGDQKSFRKNRPKFSPIQCFSKGMHNLNRGKKYPKIVGCFCNFQNNYPM
jgi:hypothetical protein